ncbi:uncharacterized protein LOC129316181 [Prosopis cineraria]|uniref:uncharacterized protein LOC129316181 n=1 Tax=Prosopis cineraria TaxID=364024 RepID=UPI00240EBACE|nr:uncharacterized protein LOC129316181 [Prosopis cineraria]
MAVCFAALIEDPWHLPPKLLFDVRINGADVGLPDAQTILGSLASRHIFMFDLQCLVLEDKLKNVVLDSGWNLVEISCFLSYINCSHPGESGVARAKWSGACVYKQKSRMVDIRFINHSQEQETVPEFLKGSSMSPDSYAELVLRRMKRSDFEVCTNNAGISLLPESTAQSHSVTERNNKKRKRKRHGNHLSIQVPSLLGFSHCTSLTINIV